MIAHALTLAARDLLVGVAICVVVTCIVVAVVLVTRTLAARADRRYVAAVERERQANRAQLRMHERHRSEMRAYNARPTASERWGGLV